MSEVRRIDPEFRLEPGDLRSYQEQASSALRMAPEAPASAFGETEPWTREAAVLALEGWSYKVRCGKRIWCRDEDDPMSFWVSEEEAYRRVAEGVE